MQGSKVAVTGGAGFIGSHVVDKLVGADCEVSVLDNLSTGLLGNVQRHIEDGNVSFFEGDVRDEELVRRLVEDVDAVVHLAAITSVPFSVAHPILTNNVNTEGTLNLLKACLDHSVQRFVLVSSCAVYGEPYSFPIDEEHPTRPLSPYAASKLAAENYCEAFSHSYGLESVVLRPFNVYGPRQRTEDTYSGVITRFAEHLFHRKPLVVYGDGSQTRDFVHVYDVAEAVWLALNIKDAGGQVFNVGWGRPVEIRELAKMLVELVGGSVEIVHEERRAGDLKHSHANITKARETLGYTPKISLENGLQSLLRHMKEEVSTTVVAPVPALGV